MLNKRTALPAALLAALLLIALAALLPGAVLGSPSQMAAVPFDGRVQVIAVPGDGTTRYVPPPESARRAPATANIVVSYDADFPLAAQQAFEYAVQIWESSISSAVPIIVDASWDPLGENILGAAGPSNAYRDFPSADAQPSTWYPSALADKLYGIDIGGQDIQATFNSAFPDWYFGTDGNPPPDRLDFVSVVLHELGHGLGFLGYANVSSGSANLGYLGYPFVYDRYTETGSGESLLALSPTALYQALTGNNVFFDGPHARAGNAGLPVRLYAPPTWQPGSSYSHVDDVYDGSPNALMTWSLSGGEAIHNPGPVALGILFDTGWTNDIEPPTATATATNTSAPTSTPTRTPTVTPLASPASIGYVPQAMYEASKDNITPPPPPTSTPTASNTPGVTETPPPPTPHGGSISGSVSRGGSAASGVTLALRQYDSSLGSWSTVTTVTSSTDGSYVFNSPPPLEPGALYYVLYRNGLDGTFEPGQLWLWQTRYLESYSAGEEVDLVQFDIADVPLGVPPAFTTVSLPYEFTWQTRPATPGDSYSFGLSDNLDPPIEFITDPLGYVGAYELAGLPPGFTAGLEYYWSVYIFTPDFDINNPWGNGWGWSWEDRPVIFNAASLQAGALPRSALPASPDGLPVDRDFWKPGNTSP